MELSDATDRSVDTISFELSEIPAFAISFTSEAVLSDDSRVAADEGLFFAYSSSVSPRARNLAKKAQTIIMAPNMIRSLRNLSFMGYSVEKRLLPILA